MCMLHIYLHIYISTGLCRSLARPGGGAHSYGPTYICMYVRMYTSCPPASVYHARIRSRWMLHLMRAHVGGGRGLRTTDDGAERQAGAGESACRG